LTPDEKREGVFCPDSIKKKMKNKIIFLFLALLLFLWVCSTQSPEETSEWKGTIEYRDGIKVVKNPEEPLYGHLHLDLEEDLSLGSEEDKVDMFFIDHEYVPQLSFIPIDEKTLLYAHSSNYRLHLIDENGEPELLIQRSKINNWSTMKESLQH